MRKHETQREANTGSLEVELHKPATRLPREALPRIDEANTARATVDLGRDLALKGPVKGHNSILLIGEKRRLHADVGDLRGESQKETACEDDGDDGEELEDDADGAGGGLRVGHLVEAEEDDEGGDDVEGDVRCGALDRGGEGKRLPVGDGNEALPEARLRGHGNDLVGPGDVDLGEKGAGERGDDDHGAGEFGQDGLEKASSHDEGGLVEPVVHEAPPRRGTSGVSPQVTKGAPDLSRDGLLGNEGDVGPGLEQAILSLLVWRLQIDVVLGSGSNGDGTGGRLDHGQRGHDLADGIVDLRERLDEAATGLSRGKWALGRTTRQLVNLPRFKQLYKARTS